VVSVESGNNQLDWRLRKDPRVVSLERTDARALKAEAIGGPFDFACMDLSFMGLAQVFPALATLLKPDATWVALVKPQFELQRHEVPEGGVVKDPTARQSALGAVRTAAERAGLGPMDSIESPIQGRDGNIEFLLLGRSQKVVHN
jgi:23S rRNA (cytidine1920-2'-O)/16S rRNA (cytidine1409-2'-O)-methyltransferase